MEIDKAHSLALFINEYGTLLRAGVLETGRENYVILADRSDQNNPISGEAMAYPEPIIDPEGDLPHGKLKDARVDAERLSLLTAWQRSLLPPDL